MKIEFYKVSRRFPLRAITIIFIISIAIFTGICVGFLLFVLTGGGL